MQSDSAEIKPAQCCIKLVFHLTYTVMHGSTKLKFTFKVFRTSLYKKKRLSKSQIYNEIKPLQLLIHAVFTFSSCSVCFSLISCSNKTNPSSPYTYEHPLASQEGLCSMGGQLVGQLKLCEEYLLKFTFKVFRTSLYKKKRLGKSQIYNEIKPLQLLIHAVFTFSSCSDDFSVISCLNKTNPSSPYTYESLKHINRSFSPEIIPGMLHMGNYCKPRQPISTTRLSKEGDLCPRRIFRVSQ